MAIHFPSLGSTTMIANDNSPDPLALAIAPPDDETSEERAAREEKEKASLQRSQQIDLELKTAKAAMKRYKKAVKVLVLGQSMSGKSTTIKNFQITYAQKSWAEERASWKAIILLNLVRSVNIIVDALSTPRSTEHLDSNDEHLQAALQAADTNTPVVTPTERHHKTILRLAPLRQIERELKKFLGAGSEEIELTQRYLDKEAELYFRRQVKKSESEFCVRSTSGWKSVIDQIRNPQPGRESTVHKVGCQVVSGCKEDIRWLWNDSITKQILHQRHIQLEDTPGFFLEDIDRVVASDYEPSDEDILRARLRTTGVQEYHFTLDRANGTRLDWIMYDVAGIRTARAAWVPFFKEVTALLFLAPLSSFNERLDEDSRTYRLEDTFLLWKALCSNKLLSNVQIILLLNKTDLLRKKLDQGIRLQKYIPEYDKPNDFENVSNWFRKVFRRYHTQYSSPDRVFISHFTSVVDTHATSHTLDAIRETILRKDVVGAGLM